MIKKEINDLAEDFSGSYWNYRWFKCKTEVPKIDDNFNVVKGKKEYEVYYELHEVYYDKKEKPFLCTEEPVKMYTNDADELLQFTYRALVAANKKVLTIKNGKIKELNEYMNKREVLSKLKGDDDE